MTVDFQLKQGDTLPLLEGTAEDANGPVDISGATAARLHVVRGTTVIVNAPVTIIDDGTLSLRGKWEYEWQVSDTDTELGTYDFELEVEFLPNKILTFPNGAKNPKLIINKQLA